MKKTEIILICDRSGSMQMIRNDAQGGINNLIIEQAKGDGDARLTIVDFDTEIRTVYQAVPIKEAPPYELEPRGGTALLDAIGQTLDTQGRRIAQEGWAELVILAISTDGEENASRLYTQSRIKEMITHAEANGWQVLFLAANQDAFTVGASLGTQSANTANWAASATGSTAMYAATSNKIGLLRSGQDADLQTLVNAATPTP